jgi:hypothetical protein
MSDRNLTFHGGDERVHDMDDVLLDTDPLLAAWDADDLIAEDWESDECNRFDVDTWLAETYRRWHKYKRLAQDARGLVCWQLLVEYTYKGRN